MVSDWVTLEVGGRGLSVWRCDVTGKWEMEFPPMTKYGGPTQLKATDAEAAKLEALHIVGEWAKQVAAEAAELRGRMVGEELNAKGAGDD